MSDVLLSTVCQLWPAFIRRTEAGFLQWTDIWFRHSHVSFVPNNSVTVYQMSRVLTYVIWHMSQNTRLSLSLRPRESTVKYFMWQLGLFPAKSHSSENKFLCRVKCQNWQKNMFQIREWRGLGLCCLSACCAALLGRWRCLTECVNI